jgi:hypothetical protein
MFELERKLLEDVKYAYCAGLIDGEGCFFISHHSRYTSAQIQLIVAMADEAPLRFLQKTFNCGKVSILDKDNKLHYRWTVCSGNAVKIARTLLPFLQGKQQQARLFIAYFEEYYRRSYGRGSDKHRNWTVLNLIESELRKLKKVKNVVEFTFEEPTPPAETEREDDSLSRCDSPNCKDGKLAEVAEMTTRLN